MLSFLKKTINSRRLITGAILILCALFSACDVFEMGLGDPVDTIPPSISIISPTQNWFYRSITQGNPIEMNGTCWDNMGVTSLRFEIWDDKDNLVEIDSIDYVLESDGKWSAQLVFMDAVLMYYKIKVFAIDKFRNEGKAEVNVRVDIVPPWVEGAYILRHPNTGFGFQSELHDLKFYQDLGFNQYEAYRDILEENIDDFQNESFTLKLELKSTFDIKASRLNIYDQNGTMLNQIAIPPTRSTMSHTPEWDITAAQLQGYRPALAAGPNYLSFEIYAWNVGSWNSETDQPYPDAIERIQIIGGTCWYPESDIPHAYINPANIINNILTISPNMENALTVEFYDDDKLSEIYLGLITKERFDILKGASQSEDEYLQSLTVEANEGLRTAARGWFVNSSTSGNRLTGDDGRGNRSRKNITLNTLNPPVLVGEYRLIALVKEDKTPGDYSFAPGATAKWSVYPSMRVQVQDSQLPLIIVEKPEAENITPSLSEGAGQRFNISGYTLDRTGIQRIQIAWVPSRDATQGEQELESVARIQPGAPGEIIAGESATVNNNIKIWNVRLGNVSEMYVNGIRYWRTEFSCTFDILTDFMNGATLVNEDKLFIIQADNGNYAYRNFRLRPWTTGPSINVVYPTGIRTLHDNTQDLILKMTVNPGTGGVAIRQGSQLIYDVGHGKTFTENFTVLTSTDGEGGYHRIVSSAYMQDKYDEGEWRTYGFEAFDILGNSSISQERTIRLSNKPLLESIISGNANGIYGIGEVLTFEASFSMPVRILNNGKPRLRLYNYDTGETSSPATTLYADADIPANNDSVSTIIFRYTVKEGDNVTKLYTSIQPIEGDNNIWGSEGGAAYCQFANAGENDGLHKYSNIGLDGVRPTISRASFKQTVANTSGTSYFNNQKTITLKLYTSEPVQVSGAPVALISYGGQTLSANFTVISKETISGTERNVINFTHTVNNTTNNIPLTQLSWGGQIQFPDGAVITDMVRNDIGRNGNTLTNLPTGNNLTGGAATGYPTEMAYIKTTSPTTPDFTIYTAPTGGTAITGNDIMRNTPASFAITSTAENLATLWYSVEGGNNGMTTTTNTRISLADSKLPNFDNTSYAPSTYVVTVWQVDVAGNQSVRSATRNVTINSRAPELINIDISLPDGSFPNGREMTFKLTYNGVVNVTTASRATLNLRSGDSAYTGTVVINNATVTTEYPNSSSMSVRWNIANVTAPMKDIKLDSLTLTTVTDAYGNNFVVYNDTLTTETATQRPVTSQISRPNLIILPNGPRIITATPDVPTATGVGSNGYILNGRIITLNFDTEVTAIPGRYITIRPYGDWAIPAQLTVADFDSVYNANFLNDDGTQVNATIREQYRRRLTDADDNGFPKPGSGSGSGWNLYIKNTHGLTTAGTGNTARIRPDTITRMVLDFNTDLYTGNAALLRTVFNAARWNWKQIHAPTVGITGKTVTITLDGDLPEGRIWEVLVDGAFQDLAGNLSQPQAQTYKFWSPDTATPVVRVEKISYDGNNTRQQNVDRGYVTAIGGNQRIPPIDIRVRIDCETPGASIRYDYIRTSFTPLAATNSPTANTVNDVFTLGTGNAAAFFGTNLNLTSANGYNDNTIGNSADASGGYFSRLLVPNNVDSGQATSGGNSALAADTYNGSFRPTYLTDLLPSLQTWGTLSGNQKNYVAVSNTGAASYYAPNSTTALPAGTRTFYIGDGFTSQSATVNAHNNVFLYSGRRDYIIAVAKKNEVISGATAGPALEASSEGMEGVFKTTLLYRNPSRNNNGSYSLLVQGFDFPVTPVVAGFPLRDADSYGDDADPNNNLFSKTAYRLGGVGQNANATNNHYIWVTWEIVTDWYQKGKLFSSATSGNYLNNGDRNYNSVTATYGGVIYRYNQGFYN